MRPKRETRINPLLRIPLAVLLGLYAALTHATTNQPHISHALVDQHESAEPSRTTAASFSGSDFTRTPTARIEAALANLGGIEALQGAGGISWSGRGRDDIAADVQSVNGDAPNYYPNTEAFTYQADDGRLAIETQSSLDGNDQEWIRRVFEGNGLALTVDRQFNVAFWDEGLGVEAEATMHRNMIVHELLAAVLDQSATLEHAPDRPFFGQSAHAVSGALADGTEVTLFIDAEDVLIGASYPLDVPMLGEVNMSWVYDALVEVEGLGLYPAGHRVYMDDRLIREMRYQELRAGPEPSLLQAPAGITVPAVPVPDRA